MKQAVQEHARDPFDEETWSKLADGMRYVTLDFADDKGEDELRDVLTSLDEERGTGGNRVYYFAVPPSRDRHARRGDRASGATRRAGSG